MTFDTLSLLSASFAAGLGLVVAGAGNALLPASRRRARVAVAAGAGVLATGTVFLFAAPLALPMAGLAAVGCLVTAAAGSAWAGAAAARAARAARRPAVAWGAVAACGAVLILSGQLRYDAAVDVESDLSHMELMLGLDKPPSEEDRGVAAVTDLGTAVRLMKPTAPRSVAEIRAAEQAVLSHNTTWQEMVIRRQPGGDGCNCHGWVFTGGRYALGPDDVARIVAENGYDAVSVPRPGDVVVYRDAAGVISHTALVRGVCDDGTVLVEGKWGWMGVFLHQVGGSCYGTNFTYYRSPRKGHILAGLGGAPSLRSPVRG